MAHCADLCYKPLMATRTSLNVSLSPELARYVRTCVQSGDYLTASEVVRESLRLLRQHHEENRVVVEQVRERVENAYRASLEQEIVDGDLVLQRAREQLEARREAQAPAPG